MWYMSKIINTCDIQHVHNDDSVYLDVIFNIDIYKWKQAKKAPSSINE